MESMIPSDISQTSILQVRMSLIYGELSHLESPTWCFICINGEKCFRTMWKDLTQEYPESFDHYTEETLLNLSDHHLVKLCNTRHRW